MAILTTAGRAGLAKAIKESVLHLAWGQGSSEWNTNEKVAEDPTQTALFREIGRRLVDSVQYCIGDDEGDLIAPTGRFSISAQPTNNLFINTKFDFEDGAGYTIREFGLFIGTEVSSECPVGQKYYLPSDITDPGVLLTLENSVPLIRLASTREEFNFVLTL